jgi:hypothetical protein
VHSALVLSLPVFFVRNASFFRISLQDLCRRLLARLTSATTFVYLENRYDESSSTSRGAPLRTVALHAMYNTVLRALINRYIHSYYKASVHSTLLGIVVAARVTVTSDRAFMCSHRHLPYNS